jgi:hypothetical protein
MFPHALIASFPTFSFCESKPGPGSLLVGVLPFRAGIRVVADHGLVQHLATLVQGTLDDTPGLVYDTLHRLTGLVDTLLEQAPSLIGYLSYGLVRRLPNLSHRLSCRVAHPLGRLAYASGQLAYSATLAHSLSGCAADLS